MTAFIPIIINLLVSFIGWVLKKWANDQELEKAFKQFAELARSENIKTIQARNRAEKFQLEQANKEWDQIEKGEKK